MTAIERTVSATSTKLTARSLSCSSTSTSRKQNRSEFAKYYTDLCHIQHSHPLNVIKQNLDKGILDFYCDRIKFDEWWSIINALGSDRTLHLIAIRSRHPQKRAIETADTELKARSIVKQPVFATRFVLLWLMESIKLCLSQSTSLTVLELEGLPLAGDYLVSLSRGIVETTSLQHLSFYKCGIGDEGAEIICHTIKNIPCILSLDLSHCELTVRGAETLSEIVKYQKLNRYSEAWKQTLRYRDPDVEAMPGLRRITINGNPNLGDKGILILTEEIKDDLWLRALDVQDCGLTDEGADVLLDLLANNRNLVIVDARGNPYMNEEMLTKIMNCLAANNHDKSDSEYRWINKNPNLNKKNFQVANHRSRPWSCHSTSRSSHRSSAVSAYESASVSRPIQLLRSNSGPNQRTNKSDAKDDQIRLENDCLRIQLRDLTIVLNEEIRHKLLLEEENKNLKELLTQCQADKRKLEEVQNNKVLIAEDTLMVLEDVIKKFGLYVSQKHEEEDETSESTTARSTNDEQNMSKIISNMKVLLKKAASSIDHVHDHDDDNEDDDDDDDDDDNTNINNNTNTNTTTTTTTNNNNNNNNNKTLNQKHAKKVRHSSGETKVPSINSESRNLVLDFKLSEAKGQKPEILEKRGYQKKPKWIRSRPTNQTIWEEDELSSNSSDAAPKTKYSEGNKTKAQLMFMKIVGEDMWENSRDKKFKNLHDNDNGSISDDSETSNEKQLTSSNEDNSS